MLIRQYDLALELDLVLRSQGGNPAQARPALRKLCAGMIQKARPLLAPTAVYEILDIQEFRHDRVVLSPRMSLHSPRLVQALGGAQQIAVAICTIGADLEQAAGAMFAAGDFVDAAILDGVGSAAVEELSQRVCREIEGLAKQNGLSTSIPLSPGEPDWPVEAQQDLFDLLPAAEIGVTLTESYMMRPLKSLSLVMGIGHDLASGGSPCDHCSLSDVCRYRQHETGSQNVPS